MKYMSELRTWQIVERLRGRFCGILVLIFFQDSLLKIAVLLPEAGTKSSALLQWQWLDWCGGLRMSVLAFELTFQLRNYSCHVCF